jgi:hypothetical protein
MTDGDAANPCITPELLASWHIRLKSAAAFVYISIKDCRWSRGAPAAVFRARIVGAAAPPPRYFERPRGEGAASPSNQ